MLLLSGLNLKLFGKYCIGLLLILIAFPIDAYSQPELALGSHRVYKISYDETKEASKNKLEEGRDRTIEADICLTREVIDGDTYYVLTRQEKNKAGDIIIWTFLMDHKKMSLYRVRKKIISRTGKVVREAWIDYRDPMYGYPDNLAHIYTISNVMQSYDLQVGRTDDFHLLVSLDMKPWRMFANIEDIETITVPAGTFRCYRVSIEPDYKDILGDWAWGARIFKGLVPDSYFWIETAAPHCLVKFSGKKGLEGTAPLLTLELTKVEQCPDQPDGRKCSIQ